MEVVLSENEYIKSGARANQEEKLAEIRKGVAEKMNKWADRTVFSYYTKEKEQLREEGEEWEDENYRLWTIKDGKKTQISKFQSAKTPWWCPKCEKSMSHKLDDKFYRLRGACFDCVLKYEHQMRLDNVWDIYEARQMRENEKSWLKDTIAKNEDYIRTWRTPQVHFSNGGWEELASKSQFHDSFNSIQTDVAFMKNRLSQITDEELQDDDRYNQLSEWELTHPWNPRTSV